MNELKRNYFGAPISPMSISSSMILKEDCFQFSHKFWIFHYLLDHLVPLFEFVIALQFTRMFASSIVFIFKLNIQTFIRFCFHFQKTNTFSSLLICAPTENMRFWIGERCVHGSMDCSPSLVVLAWFWFALRR